MADWFGNLVLQEDIVQKFGLNQSQIPSLPMNQKNFLTMLEEAEYKTIAYGYGESRTELSGTKTEAPMRAANAGANTINAYSIIPGTGVCQGDSGGGLFIRKVTDKVERTLIGIVSGAHMPNGCGGAGTIATYVNLVPHICWIQKSSGISLGKTDCL